MRKLIAIAFVVFGFASQAFGDCRIYENCPIDGDRMLKGNCKRNLRNHTQTCYYSHIAYEGGTKVTHSFYKTGCAW